MNFLSVQVYGKVFHGFDHTTTLAYCCFFCCAAITEAVSVTKKSLDLLYLPKFINGLFKVICIKGHQNILLYSVFDDILHA
jgi:hypothetical protein